MEPLAIFFFALPFVAAALLAFAVIAWFIAARSASSVVTAQAQLCLLFGAMVLLSAVQVVFSGRVLTIDPDLLPETAARETAIYVWSGRIATVIALTIGLSYLLRWLGRGATLGPAAPLWLAAMAMVATGSIFNAAFGSVPGYSYHSAYVPIALTGIALMPPTDVVRVGRFVKWCLLLVMLAGVALVPVLPDLVVEKGYRATVVGFGYRLHGLTLHANSLGLLAVVALMLERLAPSRRLLWPLTIGLPLVSLLLAQSKTQWAAAIVCAAILVSYHFLPGVQKAARARRADGFGRPALIIVAASFALAALLTLVLTTQLADKLAVLLSDRALGLLTFTGRTLIWNITLAEWEHNPMFGYGPSIWSPEFRINHGLLNVGQAHNQFVQSLGEAGLLGLLGLLAYLAVFAVFAWRARYTTRMVSVAMFALLLLRCFAEAPFRIGSLLDAGVLAHLLLFAIVVEAAKSAPAAEPLRPGVPYGLRPQEAER